MRMSILCLVACCLLTIPQPGLADLSPEDGYTLARQLASEDRKERRAAARALAEAGDRTMIPAMVDAFFFTARPERGDLQKALEQLAGERPGRDYHDWVEWVGEHTEITPKDGYAAFKLELLEKIDPAFRKVFYPGAPMRIRLEEVVWGGVRLDGIPSIDDPTVVSADGADALNPRLKDGEKIFGVFLGGEARAYPLRYLSWHEMLNDTVGGVPIALGYCTLCGSGVVYNTATPNGSRYVFGTSGLLYRSNKLMFDRQSFTLWSQLSGEPVIGRRARGTTRLEILPSVVTTWGAWLERHPDTTVIALDAEDARRRWGFDYRPGLADRARSGVSFPVWERSEALPPKAEVFVLRLGRRFKAYPLDTVLERRLVQDTLEHDGTESSVVLLGDSKGRAVRAYHGGSHHFSTTGRPDRLKDAEGQLWIVDEDALRPESAGSVEPLQRIGGHLAFWFGWYGSHPDTELYSE